MENTAPKHSHNERMKEMRRRAKAGDPEAQAIVQRQNEMVKAATTKARLEGRSYDAKRKTRLRHESQENKRKGAAGDPVAQAAYERYRDLKNGENLRKRRRQGVKPLAVHQAYLAAAATPEHIKQDKWRSSAKKWNDNQREKIAAGDPAAIDRRERTNEYQREYLKGYRARKREEAARYKMAA